MTTEIAILNRSAVALATDSAVTVAVDDGGGTQIAKIYANANKLFELVKGAAVGVMVYNAADIGPLPWESLIKAFRTSQYARRRGTLQEYADDLQEFVADIVRGTLTEDERLKTVRIHVRGMIQNFLRSVEAAVAESPRASERRAELGSHIAKAITNARTEPLSTWASGLDEATLTKRYVATLLPETPDVWHGCKLSQRLRSGMAELTLAALLRLPSFPNPWTGLVVAGFGDDEMFPSLRSVCIAGMFEDRLIVLQPEVAQVGSRTPGGSQPRSGRTWTTPSPPSESSCR